MEQILVVVVLVVVGQPENIDLLFCNGTHWIKCKLLIPMVIFNIMKLHL
jgi:hypothetical protein